METQIAEKPEAATSSENDLTEAGNAARLVERFGMDFRYVIEWAEFIVWDGTRWKRDPEGLGLMQFAKQTANSIHDEARAFDDVEKAKPVSKHAYNSRSARALAAMVRLAKDEPGVAVNAEDLDTNHWLLPCPNGTVDLRTGELCKSRREDMCTMLAGVPYDSGATLSETSAVFLGWVTRDRDDLAGYLQRALGYTLTGDVSERLLFLMLGPKGSNGKSTLLALVRHILGDYSKRTGMATLERQQFSRDASAPAEHIVRLKGARIVTAVESEEDMQLSAAKLKELVGGAGEAISGSSR
jgi:putative DNA primase/helicase